MPEKIGANTGNQILRLLALEYPRGMLKMFTAFLWLAKLNVYGTQKEVNHGAEEYIILVRIIGATLG